ncbi:CAP domain-containing protein [Streptomyces sp. NBC_00237]|uniref:CAP domain-containing protein n=1 Tax=Streptomyces sp. NBC_00237 TaxID=2975687 RepID=UPI0022566D73|nr:CAP domain-containing protein [Streptomyces sp. NBC_00237]MCX5203954.1 CAP domain-containing protein [Streptomyces sp. NBC_00237]
MGRHRRTAAGPAAAEFADGTAGGNQAGGRRKKRPAPVRTGLLGVSAAVAFGAVAVASGILPGGENYTFGSGGTSSGDRVTAGGAVDLRAQGGAAPSPTDRASAPASARGAERPQGPSKTPSPERPALPDAHQADDADSQKQTKADDAKKESVKAPEAATPQRAENTPAAAATPAAPQLRKAPASANDAAAAVLSLVNQERAKVGCSPLRPDTGLATLAANFSRDMAARGFFDHTDPDGATPWDRAAKAGIKNLGGENIARGQADAQAVMDAWMKSEGHRKNILNCEYTTLGVGVHVADGGPWWTQDFGF